MDLLNLEDNLFVEKIKERMEWETKNPSLDSFFPIDVFQKIQQRIYNIVGTSDFLSYLKTSHPIQAPKSLHFSWLDDIVDLNSDIAISGSFLISRLIDYHYNDIDIFAPFELHDQIVQIIEQHGLKIRFDRVNNGFGRTLELDMLNPETNRNVYLDLLEKKTRIASHAYLARVFYDRDKIIKGSLLGFITLTTKRNYFPRNDTVYHTKIHFQKQTKRGIKQHPEDVAFFLA
jgi:hypothetical protein